jgi:hypothetical protein
VLDELLDELLLPHAAKPSTTAPTLSSATIPRPISLKLRERLSGISRLLMYFLLAFDCREVVHFLDLNKNKYHPQVFSPD